mgnify:CR=1 FL=1
MHQHMPDVDFLPVIVNRGDQPKLVSPDIENRVPIDLICRWKRGPQSSEGGVISLTDNREPMLQGHAGFWMEPPKVHQSPPCNDMHSAMLSQYEMAVKYMPGAMPSETIRGQFLSLHLLLFDLAGRSAKPKQGDKTTFPLICSSHRPLNLPDPRQRLPGLTDTHSFSAPHT